MKQQVTIDQLLEQIAGNLQLSAETERELLEEIRGHLEDSLADAIRRDENPNEAMQKVAQQFGAAVSAQALQDTHAPWESADAIVACILPVVGALILRWLLFVPAGSAGNWSFLLLQPIFWGMALTVLAASWHYYRRWGYAFTVWGFFWVLSLIFVIFDSPTS